MANDDVIAAIATAPGRGGIGVIRVSGGDLRGLAQGVLGKVPPARVATLAYFLGDDLAPLDQGIALYFPAPRSFTGEDALELHGHGGPAVLQLVLRRCLALGARLAEPGEFTKRAFLNGKIDLAQAEGVADLIDAASAVAARSAMRSLQGVFSGAVRSLTDRLVELRMLVEAAIDFPEEEIEVLQQEAARQKISDLQAQLLQVLRTARQGILLREGLQVVLIGRPNAGKSSLLNRLAGDEVAIVAPQPGTTRDAVRESIELEGIPLHIIDTAGLRETRDEIEQLGINRTWRAIEKANVALLVIDADQNPGTSDQDIMGRLPPGLPVIRVYNKIDLTGEGPQLTRRESGTEIRLSAKTGDGVELLHREMLAIAGWQPSGEGLFMARERHLRALGKAAHHLDCAQADWGQAELLAEELRLAQDALGAITGEFSADDLLGEIFSRFCIGK